MDTKQLLDELERRIKLRIEENKESLKKADEDNDRDYLNNLFGVEEGYQNILYRDIEALRATISS